MEENKPFGFRIRFTGFVKKVGTEFCASISVANVNQAYTVKQIKKG